MPIIAKDIPNFELFDLSEGDITSLEIKENSEKNNCYIKGESEMYKGFILESKKKVRTICKVTFFKSSETSKYLTRLEFRKEHLPEEKTKETTNQFVRIGINESKSVKNFWKVIQFLQEFKNLVDTDDFSSRYKVVDFETYISEFENIPSAEKISNLIQLSEKADISEKDLADIALFQRKKSLKRFYYLLKQKLVNEKNPFEVYKEHYNIKQPGEECVWHDFFKRNKWILGLNSNIVFFTDLVPEAKIGSEDRRSLRNTKIITFDELFEFAYFMLYDINLDDRWWEMEALLFEQEYLAKQLK